MMMTMLMYQLDLKEWQWDTPGPWPVAQTRPACAGLDDDDGGGGGDDNDDDGEDNSGGGGGDDDTVNDDDDDVGDWPLGMTMGHARSMACSFDKASFCRARRSASDRFRMLTGFRITLRPLTLHHVHGPCNMHKQSAVVNNQSHSATWMNKTFG